MKTKTILTIPHDQDATETWLAHIFTKYSVDQNPLIRQAILLAQLTGSDYATSTGQSCLQQGIEIANVLFDLNVDQETLAAALLYGCVQYAELNIEDIAEQLNSSIAKLIAGVKKMDALQTLSEQSERASSRSRLDNIRKMLLAMVDDVRIVLIKLAERLVMLRNMSLLSNDEKRQEAKITQDIHAPLANRLGIGQLKWELEDLSFRYLNSDAYVSIYTELSSTRLERENYVKTVIAFLKEEVIKIGIKHTEVSGRAKHIYSIFRKMTRKNVNFSQIYDVTAFRLLVPTLEDCYAALGHVHGLWTPIPKEFDDYIAQPKANGYQSIHTAVIGPEDKTIEIQIRTFDMHQEAELGIAAHWIYKEGKPIKTGYEAKIAWLRQLMDWQLEITQTNQPTQQQNYAHLFDDHIYVFTPQGDILELTKDATPLDFAYHIHTSLGHRCRGAKVNGQIAPLTYPLKTGERVEIITAKEEHPSRDWLIPSLGYLKTSRAKSKVLQWFRVQNAEENLEHGKAALEKEVKRLGIKDIHYEKLIKKMHMPSSEELFTSLGRGDTTLSAVINAIQSLEQPAEISIHSQNITGTHKPSKNNGTDIEILGIGNLLTRIAPCCKPVPGDAIIGYVTQKYGVSIHRQDCANFLHIYNKTSQKERVIQVNWGQKIQQQYKVDLVIDAYDRHGLIHDITQIIVNEQVSIMSLNSTANRDDHTAHINLSLEVHSLQPLSRILTRITQLPNVIDAKRV